MKDADKTLQVKAIIEGDPRRPRRIALEPIAGGGPLPAMADRKYFVGPAKFKIRFPLPRGIESSPSTC
jgi:hypothetical protein